MLQNADKMWAETAQTPGLYSQKKKTPRAHHPLQPSVFELNRSPNGPPKMQIHVFSSPYRQSPCTPIRHLLGSNLSRIIQAGTKPIGSTLQYSQEEDAQIEENVGAFIPSPQLKEEIVLATAKSQKISGFTQYRKIRPKEKGLRRLSKRAYQIVVGKNSTNYKEVANELIRQMGENQKGEKNVKRRVYDALNVFIALGALKKTQNKIMRQVACQVSGKEVTREEELNYLRQKIELKSLQIQEKLKKLEKSRQEQQRIKMLLNRNNRQEKPNQSIDFPFIVVSCSLNEDKNIRGGPGQLQIKCSQPKVFGDLDCIQLLKNTLG